MKKLLNDVELNRLIETGKDNDKLFIKNNYVMKSCSREYIENAGLDYEFFLSAFVGKKNAKKIMSINLAKIEETGNTIIMYQNSPAKSTVGDAIIHYAENIVGAQGASDMAFVDFIDGNLEWLHNATLVDLEHMFILENGEMTGYVEAIYETQIGKEEKVVSERISYGKFDSLNPNLKEGRLYRERFDLSHCPLEDVETKALFYEVS